MSEFLESVRQSFADPITRHAMLVHFPIAISILAIPFVAALPFIAGRTARAYRILLAVVPSAPRSSRGRRPKRRTAPSWRQGSPTTRLEVLARHGRGTGASCCRSSVLVACRWCGPGHPDDHRARGHRVVVATPRWSWSCRTTADDWCTTSIDRPRHGPPTGSCRAHRSRCVPSDRRSPSTIACHRRPWRSSTS